MEPAPLTKGPKVFGILSMIFGGLSALNGLNSVQGAWETNFGRDLDPVMGGVGTMVRVTLYLNLALLVMSIWLFVVGIGQVRYRVWARMQTVVWSVVAIVMVLAMAVILLAFVGPVVSNDSFGGGESFVVSALAIGGTVTLLPYPIILLAWFTRPKAKQAMVR